MMSKEQMRIMCPGPTIFVTFYGPTALLPFGPVKHVKVKTGKTWLYALRENHEINIDPDQEADWRITRMYNNPQQPKYSAPLNSSVEQLMQTYRYMKDFYHVKLVNVRNERVESLVTGSMLGNPGSSGQQAASQNDSRPSTSRGVLLRSCPYARNGTVGGSNRQNFKAASNIQSVLDARVAALSNSTLLQVRQQYRVLKASGQAEIFHLMPLVMTFLGELVRA